MADAYENLMKPLHVRFGNEVLEHSPDAGDGACPETPDRNDSAASSFVVVAHRQATQILRTQLLGRIYAQSYRFFEAMIVDVMLEMGYGTRRRDLSQCLGRSHDGGIDGVIAQDVLGIDVIYLQAKRLRPGTTVPVSSVRDFVGSLEARHAAKGIFVTTAQFTSSAADYVKAISHRVILVNGEQLADLMIRHNIGVRVQETYQFKEIEPDYFSANAHNRPTPAQPRR